MDWSFDSWPSGEPYDWGGAGRGHTIYDAAEYHVDLGCGKLKKGRIGIDRYPSPGVNVVMDLDTLRIHAVAPEPDRDAVDIVEGEARYYCATASYKGAEGEVETPAWHAYPLGVPSEKLDISGGARSLPFADGEIESVISHHALEHIGEGFIPLVDEVYRVLEPGGIFYAITPLFPSQAAVADPDHKRYFMEATWDSFCGHLGDESNPTGSWLDSFSVPYTQARFEKVHQDISPPAPPEKQWTTDDVREIRVALRAVK